MALLTPGYWQTTYWPSRYWQEDYWLEYGAYVPPPTIIPTIPPRRRPRKVKPKLSHGLLVSIRDYLEMKLKSEQNA